jgi:methionine synthase II (cobalamin-independent)
MAHGILVDDIGSFPLLEARREDFLLNYLKSYRFLAETHDVAALLEHKGLKSCFYDSVVYSFLRKLGSGLDVVNYPQHYSMYDQFLQPISMFPAGREVAPFLIEEGRAIVPEVLAIQHYVNSVPDMDILNIPEESASKDQIQLKVCVTGPIEMYIHTELGFTIYGDILKNFSKSVNHFLKNSILNDERIRTSVVAIDEPSIGFVDLFNTSHEELSEAVNLALDYLPAEVTTQIHLHTLKEAGIALNAPRLDVLTCEYASDPMNVISRRELEDHGKKMRVGICRTNYNAILGKIIELGGRVGNAFEDQLAMIDAEDVIDANLRRAVAHYGPENIAYVGPDCGLNSWTPPELAQALLERTVGVVRAAKNEGLF